MILASWSKLCAHTCRTSAVGNGGGTIGGFVSSPHGVPGVRCCDTHGAAESDKEGGGFVVASPHAAPAGVRCGDAHAE